MSAPLLRRAFLLIVALALLVASCDGGEGKPGVPADLGDTNPEAGEHPGPDTGLAPCTEEQVMAAYPCLKGSGSVCTVVGGNFLPWIEGGPEAPEITWTFPCAPDHFLIELSGLGGTGTLASSEVPGDAAGGIFAYSWDPDVRLPEKGSYQYYIYARGPNGNLGGLTIETGEVCQDLPGDNYFPHLEFPDDGAAYYTDEEITDDWSPPHGSTPGFIWGPPWYTECLTYYEGQISTDRTFATGAEPIETISPVAVMGGTVTVEWCHTYYWRFRAHTDDAYGPWTEPRSFRIMPQEGWASCFQGIGGIEAVAIQDSACRIGPSPAYGIAGYAAAGDRRMIVGRNADGTWFQTAEGCYINNRLLRVEVVQGTPFPEGADAGSLMGLIPEVPDPPLPTETTAVGPGGPSGPACSVCLPQPECVAAGGTWTFGAGGCHCQCP